MYEVGQVLYVILQKRQKIIPVQVVEQIVRRTAEGEKIQYLVKAPGRPGEIDLTAFNDQVFKDIEVVKKTLQENIFNVIEQMASNAVAIAAKHFRDPVAQEDNSTHEFFENSPLQDMVGDVVKIQLDDGQIANVKIPNVNVAMQKKR